MSKLHRSSAAALLVSAALAFVVPASAAPTHPRLVEARPPIGPLRAVRASASPFVAAPLRYELRAPHAASIKPLPLPAPVRFLPALLPFKRVTLAAPLAWDPCAPPRSSMLLATLPAVPFVPVACKGDRWMGSGSDRATSLVPGRNKNALYGRAYSPHDLDAP
jgi:hypothetical protein